MIVRWLRAHPSLVWLVALALAGVGAVSIYQLPSSIYPEMTFPRIVVVAKTAQLSPDLVEAQVTRPLEEALVVVPGVRHIRARTIRGATELSLLLVDGTDPLTAQFACRGAIDHVALPSGTTISSAEGATLASCCRSNSPEARQRSFSAPNAAA